jgi:hypothetical protein
VLKSRTGWLALFSAIAIGLPAFSAGAAEQGLHPDNEAKSIGNAVVVGARSTINF